MDPIQIIVYAYFAIALLIFTPVATGLITKKPGPDMLRADWWLLGVFASVAWLPVLLVVACGTAIQKDRAKSTQ